MKNAIILGYYIAVARKEAGLTQSQLARKIKTKQPSIARAETKGCSLAFAEKAVDACGFKITNIALRRKDKFADGMTFYCI